MTGKGRPPTGQRIDVRIPAELVRQIDHDAAFAGVTRAQIIRNIIELHYKKEPQP